MKQVDEKRNGCTRSNKNEEIVRTTNTTSERRVKHKTAYTCAQEYFKPPQLSETSSKRLFINSLP